VRQLRVPHQSGFFCPDWAPKDTIPANEGPIDTYTVTWDTIPPGEPGHLGDYEFLSRDARVKLIG
jgi:hypothetical protein